MIEVQNLCKNYGDKRGVSDINFTIQKGEIVGLLGPNGAGKSTIMKMLTGYMMPTSGSIHICGCDVVANPADAGRHIGFLPEIPPLYVEMSVEDYLRFLAEIRKVPKAQRKEQVAQVMELANITHVKNRLIRNLSKGYRQRVGLAQALVGFPEVLILDEPTVGLDPKQIAEVRTLIEKLHKNHTIILSSHILSEIKMTCERVIIINQGRLVAQDTMEHLEHGDESRFLLRVRGTAQQVESLLRETPGVERLENAPDAQSGFCCFTVETDAGLAVREEIFHRLAREQLPILELRTLGRSLEESFLALTDIPPETIGQEEETV